jgi:hypothetical protein
MLNELNVTLVRAALLLSERPFFLLFLLSLFDSFFVVVILYNSCFSRRECDEEKIEKENREGIVGYTKEPGHFVFYNSDLARFNAEEFCSVFKEGR